MPANLLQRRWIHGQIPKVHVPGGSALSANQHKAIIEEFRENWGRDTKYQQDTTYYPLLESLFPQMKESLIDKGANVGIPYKGSAQDLGAFEQR